MSQEASVTHAGADLREVCIVTGLSGAGKSTALRVFEDLRCFTVDGLPASLAADMAAMMARPSMQHFTGMALGLDMRQEDFMREIQAALTQLEAQGHRTVVLFLESSPQILTRRYAATRRPHPLEREGISLEAAIQEEMTRLAPLRERADLVLDTSNFSIHDLRRAIQRRWHARRKERLRNIRVNIVSFGFKYGIPRDADMVFDLRFLPNPYFVDALRPMSGKDRAVADYVFAEDFARQYRQKVLELLLFTLPLMEAEGRFRVT
ncbi:MAG: RNase adapter RapZ, partial [Desulfovibrionaceae bacterium]